MLTQNPTTQTSGPAPVLDGQSFISVTLSYENGQIIAYIDIDGIKLPPMPLDLLNGIAGVAFDLQLKSAGPGFSDTKRAIDWAYDGYDDAEDQSEEYELIAPAERRHAPWCIDQLCNGVCARVYHDA